ncbi:regulatory-associated protein of TOR 2 isoform X2 [Iris pallida]|uniref:Regulatory-associated protein of TOR 2 isoform X2 n=1 Tax=Iris pallida TaxID=29817 RepID=A0AAX6IGL0_IRIPA|nr:regulatory-associated protein of TOR 2 isoform X2 [Iris pallida]
MKKNSKKSKQQKKKPSFSSPLLPLFNSSTTPLFPLSKNALSKNSFIGLGFRFFESSGGYLVADFASTADEGSSRHYDVQFFASNFIQAPISALLEYSGILRPRSSHADGETSSIVPAAPSAGVVSIQRNGEGNEAPAVGERE